MTNRTTQQPQSVQTARDGVTIDDIAKRAKVSKSTVSRVLNGSAVVNQLKQAAVHKAITELDYKPNMFAQGLASGKSMTIGILTQNIGSPFYDTIAQGAIEGLAGSGYTPLFADGKWEHEREATSIEALISRKVDGLLIVGGDIAATELETYKSNCHSLLQRETYRALKGSASQSTTNRLAIWQQNTYLNSGIRGLHLFVE